MTKVKTLDAWAAEIGEWHRAAFPWAKLPHVLDKLAEERREAVLAWSSDDDEAVADELSDCLICVLAAMAREGVDVEVVLARKLESVMTKYDQPQPEPEPRLL